MVAGPALFPTRCSASPCGHSPLKSSLPQPLPFRATFNTAAGPACRRCWTTGGRLRLPQLAALMRLALARDFAAARKLQYAQLLETEQVRAVARPTRGRVWGRASWSGVWLCRAAHNGSKSAGGRARGLTRGPGRSSKPSRAYTAFVLGLATRRRWRRWRRWRGAGGRSACCTGCFTCPTWSKRWSHWATAARLGLQGTAQARMTRGMLPGASPQPRLRRRPLGSRRRSRCSWRAAASTGGTLSLRSRGTWTASASARPRLSPLLTFLALHFPQFLAVRALFINHAPNIVHFREKCVCTAHFLVVSATR